MQSKDLLPYWPYYPAIRSPSQELHFDFECFLHDMTRGYGALSWLDAVLKPALTFNLYQGRFLGLRIEAATLVVFNSKNPPNLGVMG